LAKKRGLPDSVKMRHDMHFVEEISSNSHQINIRMIPVDSIELNPQQPRKELGNIKELAQSIKEKGLIEPIIIRKKNQNFEIVAGERRLRAAKIIGLKKIPSIIMNVGDDQALEVALVENIQRKELTPFEQAFALKTLSQIFGFTQEEIAKKLCKSRSTVAEIIKIASLPEKVASICKEKGIYSKSFLLELSKMENENQMLEVLSSYEQGLTRDDLRKKRKKTENKKQKKYVFKFTPPEKEFKIRIQFNKEKADKDELINILENLLESLKKGEIKNI